MRSRQLIAVLALLTFIAAACGSAAEPAPTVTPEPTATTTPEPTIVATAEPIVDAAFMERGIAVYRQNYCGSCHALSAAETRGVFGPGHDTARTDAAIHLALDTYNGEASTIEAYLLESIINPTIFYTPGYETTSHHMPAFSHLSQEDLDALVYLLANQG